jgi:molecular chaperone GrpE
MSDKKNEQHHHPKEREKNSDKVTPEEQVKKELETPEAQSTQEGKHPEPPIDTVEDLKQQLDAQSDRYLRLMAEFDNFKKRAIRDYERSVELANEKLIGELIDIRENFERAVKSGEQCQEVDSLREGMKLIFAKFDDVLVKNGLDPFGRSGEAFNPQLHDALMKVPHETVPEDHIVEVFEKGYTLKKRVIRHARVVVSSGGAAKSAPKEGENTPEC